MKKLIYLLGLTMLMVIVACSGTAEKKQSDIRVLMQDSTDAHGLQRMTARKSEIDIKYKGKEYHSFISRTPNDSLPRVVSQMGNTYVDNQIVLRLTRGNERIFSRTFTKKQFASLIGEDFMAKSILEELLMIKQLPRICLCRQYLLSANGLVCARLHYDLDRWEDQHEERRTSGRGIRGGYFWPLKNTKRVYPFVYYQIFPDSISLFAV